MTSVDSDPGRPRSFCSRTLQLKIKSRLCNADAHDPKNTARRARCDGAYLGPLTSLNSTAVTSSVNALRHHAHAQSCRPNLLVCQHLQVRLTLFPVCEWTQPWRRTRYWRRFEVISTVIFRNASFSCRMDSTLVRLL